MLDPKSWAEQTFGKVQLHDMRRTRRAVQAATHLAENPLGSLPAQMQTWKETKALYRLLEEPDVTFAALMQPHLQQTREQATSSPVVLLVQDTTAIDLSHRHTISGVGQIGNERGRGFFAAHRTGRAPWVPRGARVYGSGTLCPHSGAPRENDEINAASETNAKPTCGCARCGRLAHLRREASGSLLVIGARIGSRSCRLARKPRRSFWCERPRIGVCRRARHPSPVR